MAEPTNIAGEFKYDNTIDKTSMNRKTLAVFLYIAIANLFGYVPQIFALKMQ